jgi:hypothetical protein
MLRGNLRYTLLALPFLLGGFDCAEDGDLHEIELRNESPTPANIMGPGEVVEPNNLLYLGETRDIVVVVDGETISFRVNSDAGTFALATWAWVGGDHPGLEYGDGLPDEIVVFSTNSLLGCKFAQVLSCPVR